MPGKLIAIEGIDGSGKTVQSHLLVERLAKEGRPVETIKFPRRGETFFGKMVERYLPTWRPFFMQATALR